MPAASCIASTLRNQLGAVLASAWRNRNDYALAFDFHNSSLEHIGARDLATGSLDGLSVRDIETRIRSAVDGDEALRIFAKLLQVQVDVHIAYEDYPSAQRVCHLLEVLSTRFDDLEAQARALHIHGQVLFHLGSAPHSLPTTKGEEEAVALSERQVTDPRSLSLGLQKFREASALRARINDARGYGHGKVYETQIIRLLGNERRQAAERAESQAEETLRNTPAMASLRREQGRRAMLQGHMRLSEAYLEEGVELAARIRSASLLAGCLGILAERYWLYGDNEGDRKQLARDSCIASLLIAPYRPQHHVVQSTMDLWLKRLRGSPNEIDGFVERQDMPYKAIAAMPQLTPERIDAFRAYVASRYHRR